MDNKMETKKGISKVKLTNIPEELQTHKQWVVWKAVPQGGGKFTKVPVDPKTGANAATNNPSTWGTFEEACEHYVWNKDSGIDGIGFVFTKEDPFAGIDLDDCRDPDTSQIDGWAVDILKDLNSYCEISPSNTGIKVFTKGSMPGHGRNFGNVEMYDTGRFFTLTGETFNGYPKTIEDRSAELSDLYNRFSGEHQQPEAPVTEVESVAGEIDVDSLSINLGTKKLIKEADAAAEADEVLRINPKFTLESYAKTLPYKNKVDI
jgi:primase-polymerase (primpol)-like protein